MWIDGDSDGSFQGFSDGEIEVNKKTLNLEDISYVSDRDSEYVNDSSSSESDEEFGFTDRLRNIELHDFVNQTGSLIPPRMASDMSPIDYFYLMHPEHYFAQIAVETNRYASQSIAKNGPDGRWKETSVDGCEIKAFYAMNIMMGIYKLPAIDLYWSGDPLLNVAAVSQIMTKNRYEKLCQYLHLADNEAKILRDQPGNHKLHRLGVFHEQIKDNFCRWYRPHRELSINEGMAKFKERCSVKQSFTSKPAKFGLKVWMICDPSNGYCLGYQVYIGKQERREKTHAAGYQVAMDLIQPFFNKGHHVYFDTFFTSTRLAKNLLTKKTHSCGSVRMNRKGLPKSMKTLKLKEKGAIKQKQNGSMIITVWKDKSQVAILSTLSDPGEFSKNGKMKPIAVHNYNTHMFGVDRAGQLWPDYTIGRSAVKWWQYLNWLVVDVSMSSLSLSRNGS